jgi:hypothetical protein
VRASLITEDVWLPFEIEGSSFGGLIELQTDGPAN